MKRFIVNSLTHFWSYLLLCLTVTVALQLVMRIFIDADTFLEFLWKAIVSYVCMVTVSVFWSLRDSGGIKKEYLLSVGEEPSLKMNVLYTLKCRLFWENLIGFAIWPLVIPRLFGAITRLYFSANIMETVPLNFLVIVSVILPFLICSFISWQIVLLVWSKTIHNK